MAPEQVRGAEADARSDVWALGAILYELVAGVPAFHATTVADTLARIAGDYAPPSLRALVPDVSERVAALTALCLSKEPALRPASVAVLLEELEAIAQEAPLVLDPSVEVARTAPPVADTATASASVASKRAEALRPPKSPRVLAVAIAAAIAAIGLGAFTSLPRPAPPPAPVSAAPAQAGPREPLSVDVASSPASAPAPSPAASPSVPRPRAAAPVRVTRARSAPDAGGSPYDDLELQRRN